MGMDIYSGTLTRYYAQNWKTAVQLFAEENGWGLSAHHAGGDFAGGRGGAVAGGDSGGYGAAAGKLSEPLPPTVEKGWNFNERPLISAMREQEGKAWSLFSGVI